MALFGSFATVRAQCGDLPRFRAAFDYLLDVFHPGSAASLRLKNLQVGQNERVDLAGGAFALEQVYRTKPRTEGFFESHRRYIDVQVIVSGEEIIEVADVAALSLREDRTPAQDVLIYGVPEKTSVLTLQTGDAAVLFPVDGHMPQIALGSSVEVRKIVIKVPVD